MRIAAVLALAALSGAASLFGARPEIVEGNPSSPVRVVIYDDLQCSDCQNFRTMLDEKILPRYGSRVAFVHRDLPLPKHDWARPAAVAARWVYEKNHDLGITFRREILSEQDHLTVTSLRPWLAEFARRNNLDQQGIVDSLSDPHLQQLVEQDYLAAVARGVSRTPTIYIGGQIFVETIIYDELALALDHELSR
jgi:protein-disulfide isomerase